MPGARPVLSKDSNCSWCVVMSAFQQSDLKNLTLRRFCPHLKSDVFIWVPVTCVERYAIFQFQFSSSALLRPWPFFRTNSRSLDAQKHRTSDPVTHGVEYCCDTLRHVEKHLASACHGTTAACLRHESHNKVFQVCPRVSTFLHRVYMYYIVLVGISYITRG